MAAFPPPAWHAALPEGPGNTEALEPRETVPDAAGEPGQVFPSRNKENLQRGSNSALAAVYGEMLCEQLCSELF